MPSSEVTAINAGPSGLACARRPAQKRAAAMRLDTLPMPKGGALALLRARLSRHAGPPGESHHHAPRPRHGPRASTPALSSNPGRHPTLPQPSDPAPRQDRCGKGRFQDVLARRRNHARSDQWAESPRRGTGPSRKGGCYKDHLDAASRSDPVQSGRAKGAGRRVLRKG